MKQSVAHSLVLAFFVAAPVVGRAQSSGSMRGMDMKDMDMKDKDPGKKAEGTAHKGVGVVKKVDTAKSTVTLEPIGPQ